MARCCSGHRVVVYAAEVYGAVWSLGVFAWLLRGEGKR
jgi:hypothetical protein